MCLQVVVAHESLPEGVGECQRCSAEQTLVVVTGRPATWSAARAHCQALGGDLATLASEDAESCVAAATSGAVPHTPESPKHPQRSCILEDAVQKKRRVSAKEEEKQSEE